MLHSKIIHQFWVPENDNRPVLSIVEDGGETIQEYARHFAEAAHQVTNVNHMLFPEIIQQNLRDSRF